MVRHAAHRAAPPQYATFDSAVAVASGWRRAWVRAMKALVSLSAGIGPSSTPVIQHSAAPVPATMRSASLRRAVARRRVRPLVPTPRRANRAWASFGASTAAAAARKPTSARPVKVPVGTVEMSMSASG